MPTWLIRCPVDRACCAAVDCVSRAPTAIPAANSITLRMFFMTTILRQSEDELRAQLNLPHRPHEIGDGTSGRIRHSGHEACRGRRSALRPSEPGVVVVPVIEHVEGLQPQLELGGRTDLRALLQ